MADSCVICRRVQLAELGQDPYLVADLGTSILVMGDDRDGELYRGYAILLCKQHVREPHDLDLATRSAHLEELMQAGQAVVRAFSPCKLNYASFGNEQPHLHWHIIPRYPTDPDLRAQPWRHEDRFNDGLIGPDEGQALVRRLRAELPEEPPRERIPATATPQAASFAKTRERLVAHSLYGRASIRGQHQPLRAVPPRDG